LWSLSLPGSDAGGLAGGWPRFRLGLAKASFRFARCCSNSCPLISTISMRSAFHGMKLMAMRLADTLTTIVNAHRNRRLDDLLGSAGELWSRAKTANLKPRSVDRRHGGWIGKSPTARSLIVAGCLWSAAASVLVVRMGAVHIHISRMACTLSGFCMARERQPPQHRLRPFRQQHRRLWPLGNNPH